MYLRRIIAAEQYAFEIKVVLVMWVSLEALEALRKERKWEIWTSPICG